MKKRLILIFVVIIIAVPIISLLSFATSISDNYNLIKENNYLALYINNKTTGIAVKDKTSGKTWFSDRFGSKSNLGITYYTEKDLERRMNSYDNSVVFDQYNISEIKNGIRIEYQFGKKWDKEDYINY